jgi:hypothetical protein
VSNRQTLSNSFHKVGFYLGLHQAPAWVAILGLALFTALCILAGGGSILRLAFPAGSFAVGVLLYFRYPVLYIGFTWWIWFLTPLLARLVDYQRGWDPQRLMLLSPYLVTLVTLVTFLRYLPASYRQGGLPFVLACTGVFYGFLVGLIKNTPFAATRSLLDWLTPILFGFHLFMNWRSYPRYRQNIQHTFLWGVLVTGIYGIIQFLVAPPWDRLWLIESELTSSAGSPEPLGIRVWSTMHSPGPFAVFMMAGLLLLFSCQNPLRIPAGGVGYLAFLLSLVRSAWGGWFVGLLILISSLKARFQMRLIITVLVLAIFVIPLTTIEPFSEAINSRFQTFSKIEDDSSFNDRTDLYDRDLGLALSNGLGNGLGAIWFVNNNGAPQKVVIDSGVIDTFFTLGWFGAIPYLSGLILLLFSLIQYSECHFDTFMSVARAIIISISAQLIFASMHIGLSGLLLWGFLGIGMAAHKYYQHQRTAGLKRDY